MSLWAKSLQPANVAKVATLYTCVTDFASLQGICKGATSLLSTTEIARQGPDQTSEERIADQTAALAILMALVAGRPSRGLLPPTGTNKVTTLERIVSSYDSGRRETSVIHHTQ
jgi:hypothetical protein